MVVVEHDPGIVARADLVVELGPGAGPEGGRLVAAGTPAQLLARGGSHTARLLAARTLAQGSRPLSPGVTVRGASLHNLRGLDVTFPAGALVAVTGVSGSGKSTLVQDVLAASLRARLQGQGPVGCAGLDLPPAHPVGDHPGTGRPAAAGAGTVATLAGVAEAVRKRFAATPRAKALHLAARHFGTAQPGGRCETCQGRGVVTVALDLLPGRYGGLRRLPRAAVPAPDCWNAAWRPDIADVLEAPVRDLAGSTLATPPSPGRSRPWPTSAWAT